MRVEIGNELRQARRAKELTLEEIADKAGLSSPTVVKIERGYPVKWDSVESLAKSLGYSLTFKLELHGPDEDENGGAD